MEVAAREIRDLIIPDFRSNHLATQDGPWYSYPANGLPEIKASSTATATSFIAAARKGM